MANPRSSATGFAEHRAWVDDLVAESPVRAHRSLRCPPPLIIDPPCDTINHKPIPRDCISPLSLSDELDANHGEPEHVLRGSRSFAARSWKSRTSGNSSLRSLPGKENRRALPAETAQALFLPPKQENVPIIAPIDRNTQHPQFLSIAPPTRRSPTPSLKRQKIENLVKAHGSPTHVRVTAGGRIVPSEQSPLCHPRFGYSAIKVNGGLIKFAPVRPLGKAPTWSQATKDGYIAQDVNGRMCQIVNGTIMPLNEYNGALQLYIQAPNLDIIRDTPLDGPYCNGVTGPEEFVPPYEPSPMAQYCALEHEYNKLDQQLKDIDKTEVLHGRTMAKSAKDALVAKRRELVTSMDKLRKGMKALKEQGLEVKSRDTNAPAKAPSVSPPTGQHPPYLQARKPNQEFTPMVMPAAPYAHFFPAPFPGFSAGSPIEPGFAAQPWTMPPHGMMIPPAPFDGSLAMAPVPVPSSTAVLSPADTKAAHEQSPRSVQTEQDGSQTGLQKVASPNRSHAIPIKIPDAKSSTAVKSTLNPMSPAYKPVVGAGNTEDSSSHARDDATQSADQNMTRSPAYDDASPVGKTERMHSSSVSSFETADFFPRNTREYSTRQYAYPAPVFNANEKENMSPGQADQDTKMAGHDADEESLLDPVKHSVVVSPQDGGYRAPTAPPGTPTDSTISVGKPHLHLAIGSAEMKRINSANLEFCPVPDRTRHNVSPKAKRHDWEFVRNQPGQNGSEASSSPARVHQCQEELCVTSSPPDVLDFSSQSRDWIEGYQAGLNRRAVGADRNGQFLDGYCSGLLKSKPAETMASTGSPAKSTSRRPSPLPGLIRSTGNTPTSRQPAPPALSLTPLESTTQAIDTLKQAIIAPHNEAAILTPAADGPHIDEARFNLGAWAKQHTSQTSYGFPTQPSSNQHEFANASSDKAPSAGQDALSSAVSTSDKSYRIGSMSSIDASLHRQMPGYRVISPQLEWKSAGLVARQTSLASGSFAGAQLDGAPQAQRSELPSNAAVQHHRRFREVSLDGVTSPQLPRVTSPTTSPKTSPVKDSSRKKSPSPAKAKFESIAGKVGIKTSKEQSEPNSPPGKRRWRDVWRGGRKDEIGMEEGA